MDKETSETGLRIRTEVLGKEYVENSMKNADDFNRPLQELVTEYCWGAVWGREGLTKKERSLLNLAMLSALNRPHELKVHVKGALANNATTATASPATAAATCARWRPAGLAPRCSTWAPRPRAPTAWR